MEGLNINSRAFNEAKEKCSFDRQSYKACPCETLIVTALDALSENQAGMEKP